MNVEDVFNGIKPITEEAKFNDNKKQAFTPYQNENQKPMPIEVDALKTDAKAFLAYGNDLTEEIKSALIGIMPKLNMAGYKLRTKTMENTDFGKLFESAMMAKEVYLPWPKFNPNVTDPVLKRPTDMAFDVACWLTVNTLKNVTVDEWNKYKPVRKTFIATEVHLLLGKELNTKPAFMIINTPCGSTQFTKDTKYDEIDFQTKAAMRNAKFLGIKVYNVNNKDSMEELALVIG